MRNYITIDGGTTNSRVSLVKDKKIVNTIKLHVGARNGIDNRNLLISEIGSAIKFLTQDESAERILASGMITSEFGLYNLPHIEAPSGIDELHNAMKEITISEISEIPIVFIPGIKVCGADLKNADMMRGEETELFGLSEESHSDSVYILPGSHSKIIEVNSDGKITNFSTMLTGEMIASLSGETILKDAVDLSISETDEDFLLNGYDYCTSFGINEALFKTRVLKNLFGASKKETYSFYIGAVLCGEINSVLNLNVDKIIIGGKKQLKEAEAILLKKLSNKDITCVSDECVDAAPAVGAVKIYEYDRTKV